MVQVVKLSWKKPCGWVRGVNNLLITYSSRTDTFTVKTKARPHAILGVFPTEDEAYDWAWSQRQYSTKEPPWHPRLELQFLRDHIGLWPDEKIAKKLKRSTNALHIALVRKLKGTNRKSNLYTAAEVSRILGIPCSKTIVYYYERGWLRGKRTPWMQGINNPYDFSYAAITTFVRRYPWAAHYASMERSFWKNLIDDLWDKNPWYTPEQTCWRMGLKTDDAIKRYIHWGLLPAIWWPSGPTLGVWIIRKKAIDRFLKKDRRGEHRRNALVHSKHKHALARGEAFRDYTSWVLRCPNCGRLVKVEAEPKLYPDQVMERFRERNSGLCRHNGRVSVMTRPKYVDAEPKKILPPRKYKIKEVNADGIA